MLGYLCSEGRGWSRVCESRCLVLSAYQWTSVSTCWCSWQAEPVGPTPFDWCPSEWRPLMVSSSLACWGFGSSLRTNPGTHTQHRVKSRIWNQLGGLVWFKTCRHTQRKKRTVQACAWQYTHTSFSTVRKTYVSNISQAVTDFECYRSVTVQNNAALLEWDAQTYTV